MLVVISGGIDVRLGLALPQFGVALDDATRVADQARRAEDAGAQSLWVGDRVLAAVEPQVGYVGTDTVPERFRRALDPFVTLAAAATATTTATLGTSVLVGPLYAPTMLARALVSVHAISGGRLLAGLGVGWSPEEYAAAGVGFDRRGARLDEVLDALGVLFAGGEAGYAGRFVQVPQAYVETPSTTIPIGLSAFSDAALRRVARRADAWLPSIMLPGPRTAAEVGTWLRERRAVLDDAARAAGRDPSAITTVARFNVGPDAVLSEVASDVAAVVDATGITDAFVDPMAWSTDPADGLPAFRAVRDALVG